jgi:hypothetical protein
VKLVFICEPIEAIIKFPCFNLFKRRTFKIPFSDRKSILIIKHKSAFSNYLKEVLNRKDEVKSPFIEKLLFV